MNSTLKSHMLFNSRDHLVKISKNNIISDEILEELKLHQLIQVEQIGKSDFDNACKRGYVNVEFIGHLLTETGYRTGERFFFYNQMKKKDVNKTNGRCW